MNYKGFVIYTLIYLNENQEIMISICNGVDEIFDIIRFIGENSIVSIIQGSDMSIVTDDVIESKPFCFLIEI